MLGSLGDEQTEAPGVAIRSADLLIGGGFHRDADWICMGDLAAQMKGAPRRVKPSFLSSHQYPGQDRFYWLKTFNFITPLVWY